jgi:hypothetical protein
LIACFNDGGTLCDALDSIVEPEPVAVDDGSDDPQTLEVFRSLRAKGKDSPPAECGPFSRADGRRSRDHRTVCGLARRRRRHRRRCLVLADALDADSSAGAAWGDIQFGEKPVRQVPDRKLDAWLITYVNTLPCSALIRREALLRAGGCKLRHGYEDWELWMSLAEGG